MNETFNHRRVNFTGNGDQVVCVRYVLCDVENQNQRGDKIERRKKSVCFPFLQPDLPLRYLSKGWRPCSVLGGSAIQK